MKSAAAHFLGPVLVIILCAVAPMAAAQSVTVRSGEHENFSRLVLSVPEGTGWSIEPADSGHRLTLDRQVAGFDLTEAFTRIPRDRIASLAPADTGAALDIGVACDCHLEAFLHRPDLLVIDVIDGPAPTTSAESLPTLPNLPPAPPRTIAELGSAPVLPLFVDPPVTPFPAAETAFEAPVERSDAFATTEQAILESFARAASQGVFDFPSQLAPTAPQGDAPAIPPGTGLTPVTDPMDGVPVPPEEGTESRPGLILRTGMARDEDGEVAVEEMAQRCALVGRLDTPAWIDERSFVDQIGDGRLALTTETGRLVPDAVIEQARRYVAFGFGAEAEALISLVHAENDTGTDEEARTLATLAAIVDGADAPASAVARAIDCGPEAAIWATLARDSLDGTDDAHRDATLVGFRDLPESLRGHLGLRLAAIFSEAGESLIADQIIAEARGEVTGGGVAAELTAAELAGATLGPEAEIARLDAIAERNPRLEPETLIRLMELTTEAGRPSDPAVLALSQSLRFEMDETEVEGALAEAEARALIAGADYAGALALIDETETALGDTVHATLYGEAHAALTQVGDDAVFLDIVLSASVNDLPADVQNAVAERLLSLGFPDLALPYISSAAGQGTMAERRYLRAAAFAALGDVTSADLALEGMTGPRAQELRAAARDRVGDFTGAYEARERVPVSGDPLAGTRSVAEDAIGDEAAPPDADDALAWRAGDWAGLETSDDALLSSASRAILEPPTQPGSETPLADRQSLIGQAAETRAMTAALLERFAIDPLEEE